MKDALTSVDLRFLVQELQILAGSHLDKVYQGVDEQKNDLCFQFHKTGSGKILLRFLLPGTAYLTAEKPAYPKMPGYFAVFLRRHVGNARILSVEQRGFDRILEFTFENKDGKFTLLFELLAPGNALLLNSDGKIVSLMTPKRHGVRLLRGGAIYEPPPAQFDTINASENEIAEHVKESTKESVVQAVATQLGLGGNYAEEVCSRAGVDKAATKPTAVELQKIAAAVKELFAAELAPFSVGEEVFPFAMQTKKAETKYDSFSAAIAAHVIEPVLDAAAEEEAVAASGAKKRKDISQHQEAALAGFTKSGAENQRKGELIYEHYQELTALFEKVKEIKEEGGWKAVKAAFPQIQIDEKKGTFTLDIKE